MGLRCCFLAIREVTLRQSQFLFEHGHKFSGRNSQRLTPATQFNDVQAPLAAFALADERLGRLKAIRDVFLRKACVFSGCSKQLSEQSVPARVDGFFHWRLFGKSRKVAGCFGIVQNRLFAILSRGSPAGWLSATSNVVKGGMWPHLYRPLRGTRTS